MGKEEKWEELQRTPGNCQVTMEIDQTHGIEGTRMEALRELEDPVENWKNRARKAMEKQGVQKETKGSSGLKIPESWESESRKP